MYRCRLIGKGTHAYTGEPGTVKCSVKISQKIQIWEQEYTSYRDNNEEQVFNIHKCCTNGKIQYNMDLQTVKKTRCRMC